MMDLEIHPAFVESLPPPRPEELELLEQNILEVGRILDPLKFWYDEANNKRWILDGHNRFAIAQKHNIPFRVEPIDLKSEFDAILWIAKNQTGRRNLTDPCYKRFYYGALLISMTDRSIAESERQKNRQKLSGEFGVGERTLRDMAIYAEVLKSLSPRLRQAILNRDIKWGSPDDERNLIRLEPEQREEVVDHVVEKQSATIAEAMSVLGYSEQLTSRSKKFKKPRQEKRPADDVSVEDEDVEHDDLDEEDVEEEEATGDECIKGGKHEWESDGNGARFCINCLEDYPEQEATISSPECRKHCEGMTKTIDAMRKRIDELKVQFAVGSNFWQMALDGLDTARIAFAKLSREKT